MANEVYIASGTQLVAETDFDLDLANGGTGVSDTETMISEQIDLGESPRAYIYEISAEIKCGTTPDQYGTADFYIAEAPDDDATQIAGLVANTEALSTDTDITKNLKYVGSLTAESGAASEVMVKTMLFQTYSRYISIAVTNNTGADFSTTTADHSIILTPKAQQGQ
jgi:hypothetical protein